jgi:hypothetical protein
MAPPPRINYYGQLTQPHGCTCLIAAGLGLGAFLGLMDSFNRIFATGVFF